MDGTDEAIPVMGQAFWDERYSSAAQVWSGKPNPHLVTDTGALTPGRALDVGAGEGADAIWLAEQGWTVTAVDISAVAIDRGRAEATRRGPGVAERIDWVHTDVFVSPLPDGPYDLVSVHFMHVGAADRTPLFERCIDAVASGGTLLIVGHHPSDLDTGVRRPRVPDALYTADELVPLLGDGWEVLARDSRPREVTDSESRPVTVHDAVLVARRAG